MTSEQDSAISRRDAPEVLQETLPSKQRGRRKDRVRAAPAVSCAKVRRKKRTRAYRFSGNTPAFPAQWFYGLFRALPGDRACLPPSSVARSATNLAPASGRQDHTISPSARRCSSAQRIARQRIASIASCSNVRDDREPPLWRKQDARRET